MPGLGASFGRGAATNYQQDLANSDCILIMGSNMAEAHPVGFRWPMKAREKGGKIVHVDPRFTRTSALSDVYVGIRAGSDIAFLGGLINYVLSNERWFKEYVLAYTNAATIIEEGYQDTEDLDGLFSGYDPESRHYSGAQGHWGYEGSKSDSLLSRVKDLFSGGGGSSRGNQGMHGPGLMGGSASHNTKRGASIEEKGGQPPRDPTLQHPRCVMQILRRHFARYTPDMVARACGCTPEQVVQVAELLCDNSGRERTSSIVYAVGWTQHTTGVQMIRAAGILQLLLGNVGRPGGGIMAMRGHSDIQGSTDIPTLYDLLPGYLPQPACDKHHEKLDDYIAYEGLTTGYWANFSKFIVSLLKAWYGETATKENDFHFDWLPRIDGDYSQLPFFHEMARGKVKGYFLFGQNPGGGGPNAVVHRTGLRNLDWLVVADWFLTESAVFWKDDPTGPPPSHVKTEVFFLPAAAAPEKEGSFTNTQRLIQWHDKALDPRGDCRSDAWFVYNLGKRLKELYADSTNPRDDPIKHLTWDYEHDEPPRLPDGSLSRIESEPDVEKVLQEINGYHVEASGVALAPRERLLSGFSELKDDGSTACGGWIYSGVFPEPGRNRARDRKLTDNPVQPEWGYAWPHNRRIMYNRASADPQGNPWSERKRYLWWDAEQKKWVGDDQPDFEPDKPPDYQPGEDATGMDAISGSEPFIMKPDGQGWLFSPGKAKDGPLPAHYEPVESPVENVFYKQQDNPTTRYFPGPLNQIAHTPESDYPVVACTFRLTEHYLSGPMSRFNSWLNELQPEMFIELSPELARERGIVNGGWLTVRSPRAAIEARALVTRRLKPLLVEGRVIHQIGVPFHWGFAGETVGAVANDLTSLVADPNVSMHEAKVFACQVSAGRLAEQEPKPTVPMAPWPNRNPVPDTPRAAQPEGHLR